MEKLTQEFWNNRYADGQTGWDVGQISAPLKNYFDQLTNKNIAILIPGCGNAYEAEYLLNAGFTDVTCIDISPLLCDRLRASYADAGLRVLCGDFFEHTAKYDLIVEQTFFCALNPSLRNQYAAHMHRLLKPGGKLAGLLFSCVFEKEGPPFGGSAEEYKVCFEPYFEFKVFEPCYNSIPQRAGNELFVVLNRRD